MGWNPANSGLADRVPRAARLEDLDVDAERLRGGVHGAFLHALDGGVGGGAHGLLGLLLRLEGLLQGVLGLAGLLAEGDAVAVGGVAVDVAVVDRRRGAVVVEAGDDDADAER